MCVWLLEHERLSLAGLGAVLLVVHVLSTLTLHLALTAHFRVGTPRTEHREHREREASSNVFVMCCVVMCSACVRVWVWSGPWWGSGWAVV